MKNLSLILNVVLLVAVAVLFYLQFSSRNAATAGGTPVAEAGVGPRAKTVIAYINSDSLLNHYDFYKDAQQELRKLEEKYEAEFSNRAKGLESEIASFQQNAGNMTMGAARAREEELMRKRNNLMQYEQNLAQRLMQEQARYNDSLYSNVQDYLKEYGNENRLDVVLTYTKGSGVLFASDSLDITRDVISGLNERYRSVKAPKTEKK
ncbi:OmpH family outer membrane protein [Cesiribacter andamanensis]|uniref:Periplasmic chaperone n=1 Tax=Cesiribacter andamanensis AMV16 TaxID=1279009 RepID=M7MX02_9BACT|nr:OmpH family outer membrane protein [Cesiribacter andamanensis]EMR00953.1 periplasmic chaperone [Cesiribacter andamanensis AMV16]